MDERILSDDGHWWWDGRNWLPVEENTHEPINQTLKADGSVEDKSSESSKRPSSGPPDFSPVKEPITMTNVVVVDSDPVLLDNDGLIKPIQKISTKKPPSSLRIILIVIISLFLLFSLLLLFGYWSIPSELRDSFVFSG